MNKHERAVRLIEAEKTYYESLLKKNPYTVERIHWEHKVEDWDGALKILEAVEGVTQFDLDSLNHVIRVLPVVGGDWVKWAKLLQPNADALQAILDAKGEGDE